MLIGNNTIHHNLIIIVFNNYVFPKYKLLKPKSFT